MSITNETHELLRKYLTRQDALEEKMDYYYQQLKSAIDHTNARIDRLEAKLDSHIAKMDEIIAKHNERIARLEERCQTVPH